MTAPKDSTYPARYFHALPDGRIQCDLCPRDCRLAEGQRGLCFVRQNQGGQMILTTYGRSSGFCLDPIEKKPLAHFYPGTSVLSFGTAGCNLSCKFCQNWDISKSKEMDRLAAEASPEQIARAAVSQGAKSVAFTYNDPVIFAEYAMDTADACRALGIKSVAVTAGYIHQMRGIGFDLRKQTWEAFAVVARAIIKLRADVLHGRFDHARGMVFEQAAWITGTIHDLRIDSDLVIEDVRLEGACFVAGLAAWHALVGVAEAHGRQAGADGQFHRGAGHGVGGHDGEFGSHFHGFLNERVADTGVQLGDVEKSWDRHGGLGVEGV